MIRNNFIGEPSGNFRWRGKEPGRLENFSDAVFALAITLLLISTSPPVSFDQLVRFSWELIPFLLCITLIMIIWHQHFVFYLRYGIRDSRILVLNTAFLLVVLFYVYPLKFLTRFILYPIGLLVGNEGITDEIGKIIFDTEMPQLMGIYGVGAGTIFLLLAGKYHYALRLANELDLNEIEIFETRVSRNTNLWMCSIPYFSTAIAILFAHSPWVGLISGFSYFLYFPVMFLHSRSIEKLKTRMFGQNNDLNQ